MKGGSHVSRLFAAWHKKETHQQGVTVKRNSGFTIVEVMVVLAVTGALFLSAAIIISGRTARTQFEQSINEITARIRLTINEVSTGFYPNMGNFDCTRSGATLQISGSASGAEQGTNADCVFLGKVMQFFDSSAPPSPQEYRTYAVAGLRTDAAGNEVTSLAAASPHVIAPTTSAPGTPDNSTTNTLQYGLEVVEMYYMNGSKTLIGSVGFINSQAQYNGSQIVSGSSQVSLIPIAGSALSQSAAEGAQAVDTNLAGSVVNPSGGVFICFKSGGTNQSGLVQIGGTGGRQLSVTLKIFGSQTCS